MRFVYWLKGTSYAVIMGFVGVVIALLIGLVYGKLKMNEGAKLARTGDKENDYARAEAIRDRVDRGLVNGVRSFSDKGYRD